LCGVVADHCYVVGDQAALTHQPTKPAISAPALLKYILGQYRHFEIMEHYLHRPLYFREQFLFPLPKSVKQQLVELYAPIILM
jgi:hypothetical protein